MDTNTIGTIASVVAAIAAILTLRYTVRMSKGNIRRRIEKKQRQIQDIDNRLVKKYGIYHTIRGRALTSLDAKKAQLLSDIHELEKEL